MDGIIQITQHNSPKGFLFMTAAGAKGHPNEEDMKNATDFVKGLH